MSYTDPETNEKYIPYVVEPALGLDRVILAFLCNAYKKELLSDNEEREVLAIHPFLAPVKASILPLIKKVVDKYYIAK
jgi:glycyl-tRNA synthetase